MVKRKMMMWDDLTDHAMRAVRDVTEARVRFSGDEGGSVIWIIGHQRRRNNFDQLGFLIIEGKTTNKDKKC